MGCSPSHEKIGIVEIKQERAPSNKGTVSSSIGPNPSPEIFNQIEITLFIIGEENSKYEESRIPSNVGTLLTPQLTETNNKDH